MLILLLLFLLSCTCLANKILPEGFYSEVDGISVSCGAHHTCAIEYRPGIEFGGVLKCWGMDLAHKFDKQDATPEGTFIQISTADLHSCAIYVDETVQCWGSIPYAPPGEFLQVAVGEFHTCGLRKDQTVVCWGKNLYGEGHPPHGKFVQISSSRHYSCGLRLTGKIECWGSIEYAPGAKPPEDVLFKQISTGDDHACGLRLDGGIQCWGSNRLGQSTTIGPTESPPGVSSNPCHGPYRQVSASKGSTCAICNNEKIRCWGQNVNYSSAKYPSTTEYEQISLGKHHLCAVTMESELHCWGTAEALVGIPDGFIVG